MAADEQAILAQCEIIAGYSEESGRITRPFPARAMRGVHACVGDWMRAAGMTVRLDPAGNLIGRHAAVRPDAPRFLIGSHLDTVPNAGKYDGVLGVLLGMAAVQAWAASGCPSPWRSSASAKKRAFASARPTLAAGRSAVLRPQPAGTNRCGRRSRWRRPCATSVWIPPGCRRLRYPPRQVLGYLEAHIEQGPVLETGSAAGRRRRPSSARAAAGCASRARPGMPGTLPMELRHDALTAAAEFVARRRSARAASVERTAGHGRHACRSLPER